MLPPAAAHLFVVDAGHPEPDDSDRHHLVRVLRVRPGEVVTVSDGRGRWRVCRARAGGDLEVDGPVMADAPPQPPITVAFAPVKGDRPEWTVQKLTEVGVDRMVPILAARSVVRWDEERAQAQVARWRRVAREAAMQSRRVWLPEIAPVTALSALLAAGDRWVMAQPGGPPPTLEGNGPSVLIGPEGGWAPEELDLDLPRVGLGPTVLRAETAALAAVCLFSALRAGMVAPGRWDPDCRTL